VAKEKRNIVFSGHVQGVGFRFTACRVAGGYDITGYVRNLPDGSVECLAEGEAHVIDSFLSDLCGRMSGFIRDHKQTRSAATGHLASFEVRY